MAAMVRQRGRIYFLKASYQTSRVTVLNYKRR